MSWYISHKGTPADVAEAVRTDQAATYKLASAAEEAVRAVAIGAVLAAVEANRGAVEVEVTAHGSQNTGWDGKPNTQDVRVTVSAKA